MKKPDYLIIEVAQNDGVIAFQSSNKEFIAYLAKALSAVSKRSGVAMEIEEAEPDFTDWSAIIVYVDSAYNLSQIAVLSATAAVYNEDVNQS